MSIFVLKTAIRHLWKDKLSSFVKLIGLVVGLAASFCIASFLYHESTYDTDHPNGENTYRLLSSRLNENEDKALLAINFLPIAEFITQNVAEVAEVVRIKTEQSATLSVEEDVYVEKGFVWADGALFSLFDFSFIHGTAATALSAPNTVVVTKSQADKLFGSINPMGLLVTVNDQPLTITGVIADLPSNTHLAMNLVGSLSTHKNLDDPWSHQGYLYVKLNDHANPGNAAININTAVTENIWWVNSASTYQLQKIQDIHLHSIDIVGSPGAVDIRYLYIFGIIGLVLVFSTAFNYISLSIANLLSRTRDYGIKKIMGASKRILVFQPFIECLVLCGLAAMLAIITLVLSLPVISGLFGVEMDLTFFLSLPNVVVLLMMFIVLLSISTVYPAILVSRFRPISILNSSKLPTGNLVFVRKSLITIQFSIVIVLIISIITIQQQLNFLGSEQLGFDKEQVIVLKTPRFQEINAPVMKQQLSQLSGIRGATIAIGTPLEGGFMTVREHNDVSFNLSEFLVEADFLKTLGLSLLEGRDLTPSDSNNVIVNEATVRAMGWEHALGQKINDLLGGDKTVVGVVRDFHMNNIYNPIHPAVVTLGNQYANNILVSIETGNLAHTLAQIAGKWNEIEPTHPMEYTFLDEQFDSLYRSQIQFQRLGKIFSGIAVLIACLGLYGFAVHSAEQRTKEIGVRKVLGATVAGIVGLLSKDFLKPVLMATVIAFPIAWYAMNRWLADFAYRIDIEWWMFGIAGLMAVMIALLTVSFQAVRAAGANPVESLRSE